MIPHQRKKANSFSNNFKKLQKNIKKTIVITGGFKYN